MRLPQLVVHADWSTDPEKRWMARARLNGKSYVLFRPEPVGKLHDLFERLECEVRVPGSILIGFDFPIGLPEAYARKAGISEFLPMLREFGEGIWQNFYKAATSAEEISVRRPFYPYAPGGTCRAHLVKRLEIELSDLWRRCELKTDFRPAASPLFWTLGAKQVGKAAVTGWKEILAPALLRGAGHIAVWPFSGDLPKLINRYRIVVAETYPAEAYGWFGFPKAGWSKRNELDRKRRAKELKQRMARRRRISFADSALSALQQGFGELPDGEDQFDAFVGLCFMLEVVLGHRPAGAPATKSVRKIEGWILGCEQQLPFE